MSKIITLKDGNTIIYPRTISRQVVGDKKEMGDVQGFIDSLVPVVYKYYTVRIDLNNSDPEASCEYMDDAVGMTPGYDGWKNEPIIQSIRPCVLNNGEVNYYLQKDNYTLKEDGSASILTGADGDVMVEFPLMGYKLWNDENYQYVSVTNDPNAKDKGYCYYAHSLNIEKDCDKIYYGAYLGYVSENNLYSRSRVSPTVSTSLLDFRIYAANRGTGYGYSLESFFPRTLMQCLFIVMYKNLNSQAALGQGFVEANRSIDTGGIDSQSFCYGTTGSPNHQVKFLGIEDFWGNICSWLDGVYLDDNYNILTDFRNSQFVVSGDYDEDYAFQFNAGQVKRFGGYISKILGNNTGGFVPVEDNGSTSTYFADYVGADPGGFGVYNGYWITGFDAGVFYLILGYSAENAYPSIGARLMYKHLKDT